MSFYDLTKSELDTIIKIDKQANKTPWSLYDYEESFKNPNHYCIGYKIEEKLIGFCVYGLVLDEAEILQIVIDKDSHGKGHGYQLLNHISNILKKQKASQIFLEVMLGNSHAINLYHKSGFNIVGRRKNYYRVDGKNIDAILMAKTLVDFNF